MIAFVGVTYVSKDLTGFFYHPRILAITHLITLGWISANMLGAIYIAAPMTLQLWLPAGRLDYILFGSFAIGVSGIVTHFWIFSPLGIAGSGACIYAAFLGVAIRVVSGLRKAKAPGFVKMHILFSFINILIAALWGILIALSKKYFSLPTPFTSNLYAHIYLAAIGWVLLMVFGFSYRLIPMFLPGEPAKGLFPWISGIFVESGVLGLFLCLLIKPEYILLPVIVLLIGTTVFLWLTLQTVLKPKPIPPPVPEKPDLSILHILSSFLWLIIAAIVGLVILYSEPTEETMRLTLAFGFCGLIGSFSQIIVGMRPKLLAIFTWYHVFSKTQTTENLPRPIDMNKRGLQKITFVFWTAGSVIFATAIWKAYPAAIEVGAVFVLISLFSYFLNEALILKRIASS